MDWWAEGYNMKNGWLIGSNEQYPSYEAQDNAEYKVFIKPRK